MNTSENLSEVDLLDSDSYQPDPLFVNSRREAVIIFMIWLSALLWAVPYCYLHGYHGSEGFDPATLEMVWGIPSWIFWGIAAPWLVADIATICFCYFMADDQLGEAQEGADLGDEPKSAQEATS